MTLPEKSRNPGRFPRRAPGSARGPRPASLATSGTRDRGQRQPRRSKRPQAPPGLPAAHLRVSPPPSAPTVHPAGPGGGCSDAAPTGPRAARPGLPAPGTHRVPASPRFLGPPGGREGRRGAEAASSPPPRAPSRAAVLRSPLRRRSGPAPPPGSHFGSGGPVAITAQQLTRRRSGAGGSGGGGGGARQGGSSRGGGGRGKGGGKRPAKPRDNCPETVPQECNLGLGPC